jgi:hypothetical protein
MYIDGLAWVTLRLSDTCRVTTPQCCSTLGVLRLVDRHNSMNGMCLRVQGVETIDECS